MEGITIVKKAKNMLKKRNLLRTHCVELRNTE